MSSNRIHYISSYVDPDLKTDYLSTPSGIAKVDYIKNSLLELGYCVNLFSPVCASSRKTKISGRRVFSINEKECHYYPFSFASSYSVIRCLSYVFIYIQLVLYLFFHVKRDDTVLLYHSNPDTLIVKCICRFLKLKVILELEELYSAAYSLSSKIEKEKRVISGFDRYVIVNSIIADKCRLRKPNVVCEGQYKMISPIPRGILNRDGKIHLLYAGLFQKNADVFCSIQTAKLLTSDYVLHIAGYGNPDVIHDVKMEICEHNESNQGCFIEYHGCLFGNDYENLLKKCSVGLCTRVLDNNLSDYTFPSKVLVYLSRNLVVVCTPINCVLSSPLSKKIYFSQGTEPLSIANTITAIPKNLIINNKESLDFQNNRFMTQLKDLLI